MNKKAIWLVPLVMIMIMSSVCCAEAADPTSNSVTVWTYEMLEEYCWSEDFNGTIVLGADIEISTILFIDNNQDGNRHVTIDLNGHNLLLIEKDFTAEIANYANCAIQNSQDTGAIILQLENKKERENDYRAILSQMNPKSPEKERQQEVSLHLNGVHIESSLQSGVYIRCAHDTYLCIEDCVINGVQVDNDAGKCDIKGCTITMEKDNTRAIWSVLAPDLAGTSTGLIAIMSDRVYYDETNIIDTSIYVSGNGSTGVEFQGKDLRIENCTIVAEGEETSGIRYGEYQYMDGEMYLPQIIHSHISGERYAVQYDRKMKKWSEIYEPESGDYLNEKGEVLHTEENIKTLTPFGGVLVSGFSDVRPGDWFYDDVMTVKEKGVLSGYPNGKFLPSGLVTRAEFVTMLSRMAENEIGGNPSSVFADVKETDWFSEPVSWAVGSGVVKGTSATTFSPHEPITREQLVTILYRHMDQRKETGEMGQSGSKMTSYVDAETISDYARDAMGWAVEMGLITGRTVNTLEPKGNATRAETAVLLKRWLDQQ